MKPDINPKPLSKRALRDHARLVAEALTEAVTDAVERHARAGNSIAVWRDGRVEWVPAGAARAGKPAPEKRK